MDIREVSDELLEKATEPTLTDQLAASKLGITPEEMVQIMDIWMESSKEVVMERRRRSAERTRARMNDMKVVASPKRTVVE